jgi:hypothetical protein
LGADGYGALPFKGFTSDFRIKQTAEYTAEFTPPTAPLSSSGTVLHIKGTDAHVLDKSQGNNLKLVGNAAAVTNATNNSNISSTNAVYFDGTGDYVDVPASDNWGFGNGAWTVEFWINTTDTDFDPVSAFNPSSPFTGWGIRIESGLVKLFVSDGSSSDGFDTVSGTTTVNDGSWHHVALTSASGSNAVSCYVDGTLAGSHTFTVAISSTGQALRVGADTNTSIQRPLNGYISDLRIVGSAVYTSAFTPPTAPLSSSGTVLHIKGTDAHVLDKSQGDNLKLVGNAAAVTNATNNSNISSTNAMYFNGGVYLISDTCGDIGISGLDYTIEAWIYITAWPTAGGGIFSKGTAGTTSSGDIIALDVRTNEIRFHTDGNYVSASLATSTSLSLNTWYHVAVSREGNVHRLFLNGTLEGSTTQSYNVSSTSVSYIGTNQYDLGASTRSFYGYMQDVRVTKGLARYTSNFTVPSAHLKG